MASHVGIVAGLGCNLIRDAEAALDEMRALAGFRDTVKSAALLRCLNVTRGQK